LPLRKYEEFINKTERSKLFRQLLQEGYLSFNVFPACAERNPEAELPPDCLAAIEKAEKGHAILYKYPRFNGVYIIYKKLHHLLNESNENGKPKVIKLTRDLRKISTRNQLTYAILSVILNYQKKYLESGNLLHLRPLTGQMIKEMTKEKCYLMNNCVISRLIKNKTIMLPRGDIVYLKDLIPSGKDLYKIYVRNIKVSLGDREIQRIIKRRHRMSVSRRSICQARKELGIPSWGKPCLPAGRRGKKPYCQFALNLFSAFYPLERKAINRYAPESPGVYELCIDESKIAYPKRKSGKFYLGSAKNIKKRLKDHLNPNHKNSDLAKFIKYYKCFFRYASVTKEGRKLEKRVYDLFVETYGASPMGNKLSP
jgi:RNA polymerase sigma-54 factor